MDREKQAKEVLLKKCIFLFQEIQEYAKTLDEKFYGKVPKAAVIKYVPNCGSKICDYDRVEGNTIWRMVQDGSIVQSVGDKPDKSRVSGMYFLEALFLISYNMETGKAFLIYQMGPRFARAFSYDIRFQGKEDTALENETLEWVS